MTDAAMSSPAEPGEFAEWWNITGRFLDPDTADVPWFDKREELAHYAWTAALSRRAPAEPDGLPTFEPTGEVRQPRRGERYLYVGFEGEQRILLAEQDHDDPYDQPRAIYRCAPAPPAKISAAQAAKRDGAVYHIGAECACTESPCPCECHATPALSNLKPCNCGNVKEGRHRDSCSVYAPPAPSEPRCVKGRSRERDEEARAIRRCSQR